MSRVFFILILLVVNVASDPKCNDQYGNKTTQLNQDTEGIKHFGAAPKFINDFTRPVIMFTLVFITMTSIGSNSLVIHVVRVNPHMRTTTNYFIVNMACGDMLSTILFASHVLKYIKIGMEWSSGTLGLITCRAYHFVCFSAMFCSMFSLVVITFDRFMAVSHPLTYKYSSWWTKYIIPAVWIAALAFSFLLGLHEIPLQKYPHPRANYCKAYCIVPIPTLTRVILCSVVYCVSVVVTAILYSVIAYKLCTRRVPGEQHDTPRQNAAHQTAKKVTVMIICVILAFQIGWTPIYYFYVHYHFASAPYVQALKTDYMAWAYNVPSFLVISNGFLNALIYCYFNENFRQGFKRALGIERFFEGCKSFRRKFKRYNVNVVESQST